MARRLAGLAAMCILAFLCATASADETLINLGVDPPRPLNRECEYLRMKAERLRFYFSWDETRVEAEFDLENLNDGREMLTVGFPDDALVRAYMKSITNEEASERGISAYWDYIYLDTAGVKPYRDFATWVGTPDNVVEGTVYRFEKRNDTAVLKSEAISPDAEWDVWPDGEVALWHCTKLRWEPHETITIGHTYTADNGGHGLGWWQPYYSYVLATGGNWAGTIGRAEVDLYLEGGMTIEDLALGDPPCAGYDDANPQLDGWEVVSPTHLHLVWEDFDPVEKKAYIRILARTTMELVHRQREFEGLPTQEEAVEMGIIEPKF